MTEQEADEIFESKQDVNFIKDYSNEILTAIPETSPDWAESIATALLSSAAGKDRLTFTRKGPIHLNVWSLYLGRSGIAHKTTPLKYFAKPLICQLDESFLIPPRFSVEGLTSHLTTNPQGILIRDEFSSAFKEANKDYLSDIMEFLSEGYDGDIASRVTKKGGLETVKNGVYINLLAASTLYLFKVMKPDFFIQGTGNRMDPIFEQNFSETEDEREDPWDYFVDPVTFSPERQQLLEKYATYLENVRASKFTSVRIDTDQAGPDLLNYKAEIKKEIIYRYKQNTYDMLYPSFMARLHEKSIKYTALHCISRQCTAVQNISKDGIHLLTERQDSDWALAKMKRHFEYFKAMMTAWSNRPEPSVPKTSDFETGQIIEYLRSKDKGETWRELRRAYRWQPYVWKNIINQLFETKRLAFLEKKTDGRPALIITLFEYRDNLPDTQEIESWQYLKAKLNL